jgi:group II intron reverse transcriptase/maturase
VEEAERRPFTTLAHHVDIDWLREAAARTRKDGAPGVDGQTGEAYNENLEENLRSLHARIRANTYEAPPVRGVEIPKGDGKTRLLGIPTYEDKIFQRSVVMLLEPLYEPEFHPDSYGFRPKRSAHQALEALWTCLMEWHGGWVVEVDIRKFFDTLGHDHLMAILQKKVRDGKVLQWIGMWLRAGIQKDGSLERRGVGTPQGGVISPLLANIYLHQVLDRWFELVRLRLQGRARLIRFADDFVIVFEREEEARRVMEILPQQMGTYGLTLHPDKTRLIPFHQPRPAWWNGRDNRPKPGCFDLLGFTHVWDRTPKGTWVVRRKTAKGRLTRSLKAIRQWCRLHRHEPIRAQHEVLCKKVSGHFQYYGIRGNLESLWRFSRMAYHAWVKWLARRSQKVNWERLIRTLNLLPLPIPRLAR